MSMLEKLLLPEIRELIHNKDLETLRETLNRWLPADIGELIADLTSIEDVTPSFVPESFQRQIVETPRSHHVATLEDV